VHGREVGRGSTHKGDRASIFRKGRMFSSMGLVKARIYLDTIQNDTHEGRTRRGKKLKAIFGKRGTLQREFFLTGP